MIDNDHEFMVFAMKKYSNPQLESIDEFQQDIARLSLIKRAIDRSFNNNNINVRLLINHFIVLRNVFGVDLIPLIEYKFKEESKEFRSVIKSIMLFLGWISSVDMVDVQSNNEWNEFLRGI